MGILALYRTDAMLYAIGFMQCHLIRPQPKRTTTREILLADNEAARGTHNKVVTGEVFESACL